MVRTNEKYITKDELFIIILGIENVFDQGKMSSVAVRIDEKAIPLDKNFEKFHRRLKPLLDVKFYLDFEQN